jgi:hypothetical protein
MDELKERLKDLSAQYIRMSVWLESGTLSRQDAKQFQDAIKEMEWVIRRATEDNETNIRELTQSLSRGSDH